VAEAIEQAKIQGRLFGEEKSQDIRLLHGLRG